MPYIRPVFFIFVCFILFFASCSNVRQFNDVDRYFAGLDALKVGQKDRAIKAFTQSGRQDSQLAAIFATEELLPLLYENGAYYDILDTTSVFLTKDQSVSDVQTQDDDKSLPLFEIDKDLVQRYHLLGMIHTGHPNTIGYIIDWVNSDIFSREHVLFFESDDFLEFSAQNMDKQNGFSAKILDTIAFRVAVYKRNYLGAIKVGQTTVDDSLLEDSPINNEALDVSEGTVSADFENLPAFLLSDIGKALLYSTADDVRNAELLEQAAETYPPKSDEAFMCHFYAARLYEKAGVMYRNRSLQQFKAAMDGTPKADRYDNALWYYLNTVHKTSARAAISSLQEFAPQWNDTAYFDDFLSSLGYSLLSNQNWKGFYGMYNFLIPYISDESLSKYAYISGRLIEEGFLNNEFSVDSGYADGKSAKIAAENAYKKAFETAFKAGEGSSYYRIMAAGRLNLSTGKVLDELLERKSKGFSVYNAELTYILGEYITRGYAQQVAPLYIANSTAIDFDSGMDLSNDLVQVNKPRVKNNFQDNLYSESLRIASRALNEAGQTVSKNDIKNLYPRFYAEYVAEMANMYGLSEYLLYALIRSESFFDYDVYSVAGAVGLTQLMPSTAGDIARKLKLTNYDLHDAKTNIQFGAFYLDELIPRVDNSMLSALFSYNAGITNLRRWVTKYPQLSEIPDIFLEIIPFGETREYGRKILSAATMYGMLYYKKTPTEMIDEIMQ